MFDVAGYLGVSSKIADRIVNAIDYAGVIFIASSIVLSIGSAGGLALSAAGVDFMILTVQHYLRKGLKRQAIVW